eukprot:4459657-Amphidinium_carterae.1
MRKHRNKTLCEELGGCFLMYPVVSIQNQNSQRRIIRVGLSRISVKRLGGKCGKGDEHIYRPV